MNRHAWREIKRQLKESGAAGFVAVALVAVASAWGGVLWTAHDWINKELLATNRPATVVAIARGNAEATALRDAIQARVPETRIVALAPRKVQEELAGWFPELATVLLTLDERSFPPILEIEVSSAQEASLVPWLQGRPEVTLVESSRAWQARLQRTVSQAMVGGFALAMALLVGCGVVVLLVVRLLVLAHADEIAIMRLIGAHEGNIRRPYLLCGSLLGAAGGVAGTVILFGLWLLVRNVLPSLTVSAWTLGALPAGGALAGAVGALIGLAALPSEP
ncbi:MAG: FtsX-like permease family protein [Thermoanaerobaculaceae bacterium]|jgi:cell division protein FtsX